MFRALNILILIFYKILDFHFLHFSIERKFIIIIIIVIISFSGFFFNVRRFWILYSSSAIQIHYRYYSPLPQPPSLQNNIIVSFLFCADKKRCSQYLAKLMALQR